MELITIKINLKKMSGVKILLVYCIEKQNFDGHQFIVCVSLKCIIEHQSANPSILWLKPNVRHLFHRFRRGSKERPLKICYN